MPGLAGLGLGGQPATQDRHAAFLNGPVDRQTVAPDRVVPPASPYILQAGAVIPAALITGIRSDLPGQITAQDAAEQPVQEQAPADVPVVTPVEQQPTVQTPTTGNYDNEPVRREDLSVVSGDGLNNYSVVVGSFSVRANAEGLQQRLKNAGYNAQLAYNAARNMYRVVASSFGDKGAAVQSRNQLRSQYPDAWLLAK